MKLIYTLALLSSVLLVGCIEEPKTSDNQSSQSYSVNYSGVTSWAELGSMTELQAFVDVFELYHRNQGLMDYWPTQLVDLTPDADLSAYDIYSCGEQNTITFNLQVTGVVQDAEVGTGEDVVAGAAEETGFNNQVTLTEYCLPDVGWVTHPKENGSVSVVGDADNYTANYYNYRKAIPAFYEVRFGGQVLFKPTATNPSKVYDLVIAQNQTPALTAKYEDLIVSDGADGQIYSGIIYHPSYGQVYVTTTTQVITADADVLVNRPIAGTLRFSSGTNMAFISFNADSTYDLELDLGSGVVVAPQTGLTW